MTTWVSSVITALQVAEDVLKCRHPILAGALLHVFAGELILDRGETVSRLSILAIGLLVGVLVGLWIGVNIGEGNPLTTSPFADTKLSQP